MQGLESHGCYTPAKRSKGKAQLVKWLETSAISFMSLAYISIPYLTLLGLIS